MRTFLKGLVPVLLVGCASSGGALNTISAPADSPVQEVMDCVDDGLDGLEYQVVTNNPMGPLRAERINDVPFWREIIGFNDNVDIVDANFAGGQLRMSVYSQVLQDGQRLPAAPRNQAIVEIQPILANCS